MSVVLQEGDILFIVARNFNISVLQYGPILSERSRFRIERVNWKMLELFAVSLFGCIDEGRIFDNSLEQWKRRYS